MQFSQVKRNELRQNELGAQNKRPRLFHCSLVQRSVIMIAAQANTLRCECIYQWKYTGALLKLFRCPSAEIVKQLTFLALAQSK